jgi:hypothetical protein
MSDEGVKVAVRVRPFNDREKANNSECIVSMNGPVTILRNPDPNDKEKESKFTFDYS